MILSDRDIKNRVIYGNLTEFERYQIVIDPFTEGVSGGGVISYGLTSAGYDLRLGPDVMVFDSPADDQNLEAAADDWVDPKQFQFMDYLKRLLTEAKGLQPGTRVAIPANGFVLGVSLEYLKIPRDLKGRCVGKSTYARCGLHVCTTPLEPGWEGYLTIEVANLTSRPAVVYIGEGICQLEFETLSSPPLVSYADKQGKYQNQQGVTVARVL